MWGDCALSPWARGGSWAPPARSCCGSGSAHSSCGPASPTDPSLLLAFSEAGARPLSPACGGACQPPGAWAGRAGQGPVGSFTQGCAGEMSLCRQPTSQPPEALCIWSHASGAHPGTPSSLAPPLLHVPPETAWPLLLKVFPHPFHLWVYLPLSLSLTGPPQDRWGCPLSAPVGLASTVQPECSLPLGRLGAPPLWVVACHRLPRRGLGHVGTRRVGGVRRVRAAV